MASRRGGDPGDDTRAAALPPDLDALLDALTIERFGPLPARREVETPDVLKARRRALNEAMGGGEG